MKRRPRKRSYPSQHVDVVDIRYLGGTHQHYHQRAHDSLDIEVAEFDVYLNGVWKGRFDNSPTGLIDFLEAMK